MHKKIRGSEIPISKGWIPQTDPYKIRIRSIVSAKVFFVGLIPRKEANTSGPNRKIMDRYPLRKLKQKILTGSGIRNHGSNDWIRKISMRDRIYNHMRGYRYKMRYRIHKIPSYRYKMRNRIHKIPCYRYKTRYRIQKISSYRYRVNYRIQENSKYKKNRSNRNGNAKLN